MAGIEEDGERRGKGGGGGEIFHHQFGGIKTTLYALRGHHVLSATLSQEGHTILISARRNTRVLPTLVYNEQFLKFTRSKRTPVNVDNGQFSVSLGTNSPTLSIPAIYGNWLFARRLLSLSQSRANCRHCTLFKKWQISLEHRMNMALQKYAHGATNYLATSNAQHYVKMLCTKKTKPPSTRKFYVDFKKYIFFQRSQNWHTPSFFTCFVPYQVDLWAETLPFLVVLPPENT